MLPQRFYDVQLVDAHPSPGTQNLPQIRVDYRNLEGAITICLVVRDAHGVLVPAHSKAGPLPFEVIVFNGPTGLVTPQVAQDETSGRFFLKVVAGLLSPVGIRIREDVLDLKFNRNTPIPTGWYISDRHILILKPQQKCLGIINGSSAGGGSS